jgi:hypothetical protein
MPVRQLKRRIDEPDAQELLRRLVSEWKNPDPNAAQPVILEEREGKDRIQVFVIWDDWGDLTGMERSEIVYEAFEQRYGQLEAFNLRSAMGLTQKEADNLGIK